MSAHGKFTLSQTLFLRLNENQWTQSLERVLRDSPPGGVLLAEPLPRSLQGTRDLTGRIRRACKTPILVAIREEGGTHNPLARYFPALPSPRGAAGDMNIVAKVGELIGKALKSIGANTNFAPLLDLATPLSDKRLRSRCFGSDAGIVTECGDSFLRGMARHGILACGKHFPGLGSVPFDKVSRLPVSGKPMAALWSEDLVPFRRLLPKLPMVLLSAAAYKAYDFETPRPACLSSFVIEGLLREKLGYRGVAIGFDLEQKAVQGTLGFGEAVVQALRAGCDVVIVNQGAEFSEALKALRDSTESGRLSPKRASEALARVRAVQRRIQKASTIPSPKELAKIGDEFRKFSNVFSRGESGNV